MSQIQQALDFLKGVSGHCFSAQAIKAQLGLACQESTLGRKMRDKAAKGIISRRYKRIASGEEIAVYYWLDPLRDAAIRDALEREAAVQMGNNGEDLPHHYPEEPNDEPPTDGGKMEQRTLF